MQNAEGNLEQGEEWVTGRVRFSLWVFTVFLGAGESQVQGLEETSYMTILVLWRDWCGYSMKSYRLSRGGKWI